MRVLLGCTDLFFATKVHQTAQHTGAQVSQVREDLAGAAARLAPDLVIVDLDAEALEPVEAIRRIRGESPALPVVAFVRHEEAERIRRAREAGASEILARGAFTARLPALLGG